MNLCNDLKKKSEKQKVLPIINGKVIQPPFWRFVVESADIGASPSPETETSISIKIRRDLLHVRWSEILEHI